MLNKPIITLKSLKYLASLSEETPAYTATICVNGKPFCDVSNDGHGGSDNHYPLKGKKQNEIWGDVKELDGLIAATYPRDARYDMEESLECLCHGLVYEEMDKKALKSLLARKVVMLNERKEVVTVNGKKSDALIAIAAKQWPSHIILNRLDFNEAYAIYRETGHAASN